MSGGPTSPAPAALRLNWDVFISFRGEDTRHGFTKHLYESLQEHGIRAFLDDEGMTHGDKIPTRLLDAIEDSALSIIVISPRYADSHWCLEELARICELGRLMIPVFYEVDPSHVRRQKGPFENDFRNHLERFGKESVDKWRRALETAGNLKGFPCRSSKQEQIAIQLLVKRVLSELRRTPVGIANYTVGLDSRVEQLLKLLDYKSRRIQVLGLYGMGGVGKTTLATALYNKLIAHYPYRCFLPRIGEISLKENGLLSLQNKLLQDLSQHKVSSVNDVKDGIRELKLMVGEKGVLIVLDDVNHINQLNALAEEREWFGEGSRIIITTRDKEVLVDHIVNEFYEVRELNLPEAVQLFNYHALRRGKPTDEYMNLSKQIVSLTGGLPLALEVFGSFLFDKRRIDEWKDALERLKEIRPHHLQDVLKISYDGLEKDVQNAFLDIACLFIRMQMGRGEAIDILKGCGFRGEIAVTILTEKCLMKISEDLYNSLWMHDQVRDMGRQIVHEQNVSNPGMRSRLWDRVEIINVLEHDKGTGSVEGIVLDFIKKIIVEKRNTVAISFNSRLKAEICTSALAYLKRICQFWFQTGTDKEMVVLHTKSFKSMTNLRLLQINHTKLEGNLRLLPRDLKWLQWKGCPLKNLPSDYSPGQLAVLDLSESVIERLWSWGTKKVAENLTILVLRYCHNLLEIPDLSGFKSLEKLDLHHCIQLTKIHNSVGDLKTLLHLNLAECSNLVEFPNVSGLKLLNKLVLSDCTELKELPKDLGCMNSLKEFLLDRTAISKLPDSIYRLTKLEKLSLNGCPCITSLPESLGKLISLNELSLNRSALKQLPDSLGSLSNLEKLSMISCDSVTEIPQAIGNMQALTELDVCHSVITELPTSIGSLTYLRELSAGWCRSLSKLPYSIGGLSSLNRLDLGNTSITGLPDQIGDLKMIEKLEMINTPIKSLPEAIGSMSSLTTLNLLGAKELSELPESIGMLENLVSLKLNKCEKLHKLPASIGNLGSLRRLLMEETAITELPESFGMLCNLLILKMKKQKLKSFYIEEKLVRLPKSFYNLVLLEELDACAWRISGEIPDEFQKLSALEILDLGYNNFCSLPSSLRGLSLLRKLSLSCCEELKSLPLLPSSLQELDAANCTKLDNISDISNLENLQVLNLNNCEKIVDIPGIECLKSLIRLFMIGCQACSSVKRRLSKVCLRNIRDLSMPGSEIPNWFAQEIVFSERKNRELVAVIIGIVYSLDHQMAEDLRHSIPVLPDVQARILKRNKSVFNTTLHLLGVPRSHEDQIYLCRYAHFHPLVSMLKDGCKIDIIKRQPPVIEGFNLKKYGIYMVFDDDDDYEGNEESLAENLQSLSQKLAIFFNSTG